MRRWVRANSLDREHQPERHETVTTRSRQCLLAPQPACLRRLQHPSATPRLPHPRRSRTFHLIYDVGRPPFHGPTRSPASSPNSTPWPPAATPSTGTHTCADTPPPSRPAASAPQRRTLRPAGAPLPVPKSSRRPERAIALPTPLPPGTTSADPAPPPTLRRIKETPPGPLRYREAASPESIPLEPSRPYA